MVNRSRKRDQEFVVMVGRVHYLTFIVGLLNDSFSRFSTPALIVSPLNAHRSESFDHFANHINAGPLLIIMDYEKERNMMFYNRCLVYGHTYRRNITLNRIHVQRDWEASGV